MKCSRFRAGLAGVVVLSGVTVAIAAPAGATTTNVFANCTSTPVLHGGGSRSVNVPMTVTAPALANPGDTIAIPFSLGYSVAADSTLGLAQFSVDGATPDPVTLTAGPGASSISGSLSLTVTGGVGDRVDVVLTNFGQIGSLGSFDYGEGCVPAETSLIARIPIGVPASPADPTISVGDASVVEGNLGAPRLLRIPVVLSSPASVPVTVQYVVTDVTAVGGISAGSGADFRANTKVRTLTFKPGSSGLTPVLKYVGIPVLADASVESDETMSIDLSAPSGGYSVRDAHGGGTIIDDDASGGVSFAVGDVTVTEGQSRARTLSVLLSLNDPQTESTQVSVDFTGTTASCAVVPGAPPAGIDCRKLPQARTLTFAPGQTARVVTITVYPDLTPEIDEAVRITLAGARFVNPLTVTPIGLLRGGAGELVQRDDD